MCFNNRDHARSPFISHIFREKDYAWMHYVCVRCEKNAYKHEIGRDRMHIVTPHCTQYKLPFGSLSLTVRFFTDTKTFWDVILMHYWQIIAPLGTTISRGEGRASDGGELQKGWRTRGGEEVEVYIFVAKTPVAPLLLDSHNFSKDSEDSLFFSFSFAFVPVLSSNHYRRSRDSSPLPASYSTLLLSVLLSLSSSRSRNSTVDYYIASAQE